MYLQLCREISGKYKEKIEVAARKYVREPQYAIFSQKTRATFLDGRETFYPDVHEEEDVRE